MDIVHLNKIGKHDSYPIFVDSMLRDKDTYPEPSEYEIKFDRPIQNVIGLDVLDASIPATMYAVDDHNNTIALSFRLGGTPGTTGLSIPDYIQALSSSKSFRSLMETTNEQTQHVKIVRNFVHHATVEPSLGSNHHFIMSNSLELRPFSLHDLTNFNPVGNTLPLQWTAEGAFEPLSVFTVAGQYYWKSRHMPLQQALSVFSNQGIVYAVISAHSPSYQGLYFCDASQLLNLPLGDVVQLQETGPLVYMLTGFEHREVRNIDYSNATTYLHEYSSYMLKIEVGDHTLESLSSRIKSALPTYSFTGNPQDLVSVINIQSASALSPNDFTTSRKLKFVARDFFWFDMKKTTMRDVLGFSTISVPGRNLSNYVPIPYHNNRQLFGALKTSLYTIVAPGIVNLYGERFVILRCPQIEENSTDATFSYESFTCGIGLFKLYNTTLSHLRFDFTTLRKLESHPIGKISKLKFRFERVNGELYDFKGVDHHLFINIKYIKPSSTPELLEPRRRLNPTYDPDIMKYLSMHSDDCISTASTTSDDDSDDQADDVGKNNFLRRTGRFCHNVL